MATALVPQPFPPGFNLVEGTKLSALFARHELSTQYAASATGTTAATGTAITTSIVHFGTVVSGGYAILPQARAGLLITVFNGGAQTLNIAPQATTDVIDAGSVGAATTLSVANRVAQFFCISPGRWISALLGAVSS